MTHLELELEDGHDVLLVVVDLAGPLEAGLHVRPELLLQQLIDSRPGVNVIKLFLEVTTLQNKLENLYLASFYNPV